MPNEAKYDKFKMLISLKSKICKRTTKIKGENINYERLSC